MNLSESLHKGSWVIIRHSRPFFDEPHQVEGTIVSIKSSKRALVDKITRKNPVDILVETKALGRVKIERVTPENLSLVIDSHTVVR